MTRSSWHTFRIDDHPDFRALPRDRCTLTMLQGPTPGAVHPITGDEMVLGRDETLPARIDDRGMSRRHARIFRFMTEWAIEDLGSTNGTFVNGERLGKVARKLADGDRLQLGETTVVRISLQDAKEQEVAQKLYESTVRDGLTGAFNRRHFEERLASEYAFSRRHHSPLTVVFADIDYFKKLNDSRGHQAGDAALSQTVAAMLRCVRAEDVLARYGGEEFVVLARAIDRQGAARLAERLRLTVEANEIAFEGGTFKVTASFGHATSDQERPFEQPEQLVAAADHALYAAKQAGRNRVVAA